MKNFGNILEGFSNGAKDGWRALAGGMKYLIPISEGFCKGEWRRAGGFLHGSR